MDENTEDNELEPQREAGAPHVDDDSRQEEPIFRWNGDGHGQHDTNASHHSEGAQPERHGRELGSNRTLHPIGHGQVFHSGFVGPPREEQVRPTSIRFQRTLLKGPLPPPEILAGYRAVGEDVPERILRMAEDSSQTDNEVIRKNSEVERISTLVGVGTVAALGIGGFAAGTIGFSVSHDPAWLAIGIGTTVVVYMPRLIEAVKGLKSSSPQDSSEVQGDSTE